MGSDFRLMDVARSVVEDVNRLMATSRHPLRNDEQLRLAVQSVASNIREGYGRRTRAERNVFLGYARASADETDEHLTTHYRMGRIRAPVYWQLHNRLIVISRMITRLLDLP